MQVTYVHPCGHNIIRDVDARLAANRSDISTARQHNGVVVRQAKCSECTRLEVNEFIETACAAQLREVLHANSTNIQVRAKIFQVKDRGPVVSLESKLRGLASKWYEKACHSWHNDIYEIAADDLTDLLEGR